MTGKKPWTSDEVWWLVQAWQEIANILKDSKPKLSSRNYNKLIHEQFVERAGGSSPRTIATIATRKIILRNSYVFIRSKRMSGEVDWFGLTTNHQQKLMQMAGKEVRPMEERVFDVLDALFAKGGAEYEEIESEIDSDGDKDEKVVHLKKPAVPKKKRPQSAAASTKKGLKNMKSTLEEETGELMSEKGEESAKSKRRRVDSIKSGNVKDILDRQSEVLADFLDKRAKERTQEHERSRKEREADQKFWAEETEKDRALLRDLFTHE
ncbi:hypothetical protein PHMEG_00022023 [Phytophthora megakarya]|uniref:Uncharacterized protein n=1 Tax=Phytophthora megakarya TaxID=4795 RepID=A0A225VM29_9STRA|nr:hypothetical protein PHMEG_00022023 [Phytophthora megakarya]